MIQRCDDGRRERTTTLAGGSRHSDRPWAAGYGFRLMILLGGSVLLALLAGCLQEKIPSTSIDTVYNSELVRDCMLQSSGTYEAIGEKNALTMARNAVAQKGGNVLLITAITRSDWWTTRVEARIYLCDRRP